MPQLVVDEVAERSVTMIPVLKPAVMIPSAKPAVIIPVNPAVIIPVNPAVMIPSAKPAVMIPVFELVWHGSVEVRPAVMIPAFAPVAPKRIAIVNNAVGIQPLIDLIFISPSSNPESLVAMRHYNRGAKQNLGRNERGNWLVLLDLYRSQTSPHQQEGTRRTVYLVHNFSA